MNYLNPLARGLEPGDSVTISGAKQILCDTFASAPGDYVRVLMAFSPTAATVPEPGSPSLLGSGLIALAALLDLRKPLAGRSRGKSQNFSQSPTYETTSCRTLLSALHYNQEA